MQQSRSSGRENGVIMYTKKGAAEIETARQVCLGHNFIMKIRSNDLFWDSNACDCEHHISAKRAILCGLFPQEMIAIWSLPDRN